MPYTLLLLSTAISFIGICIMSVITPPPLTAVQGAVLKDLTAKDGTEKTITSDELWASQPVLLLVLRRPGCVLCRGESKSLWERKAEFQKLNVRMVCVLHEAIPAEVKDFWPDFW